DLVAVPLQALEQVVQVGAQHVGMPDRDAGLAIVVGDLDRVFLVLADTEGGERVNHRLDPRTTARAFLLAAEIPIHEVERAGEGEGAQNDRDRPWRDDGLHDTRALDLGYSLSSGLCHSVLLVQWFRSEPRFGIEVGVDRRSRSATSTSEPRP